MKKSVLLSASILALTVLSSNAQTATPATPAKAEVSSIQTEIKQDAPSLKKEELPEAVIKTLATDEFKGMEFVSAKLVKTDQAEYYEISLKQSDKTAVIKIDKDGKKVI